MKKKSLLVLLTILTILISSILISFPEKTLAENEPNYLTFTAITDSTVTFNYGDGNDVYYSTDNGANWVSYTKGQTITLNAGKTLKFKGLYVKTNSSYHFSMTGKIAASGSVTSLTDANGGNPNVELTDNCYSFMFDGCEALVSTPSLPATNLKPYCYYGMFVDCTNLKTIECFPVSSLSNFCYGSMFDGCTGLTSIPENLLPTKGLAGGCYFGMFKNCTGLTYIPENLLPAGKNGEGSLAEECYEEMFEGCTGLTLIPKNLLPATNLCFACYRLMFRNCTSLVTILDLPSQELDTACYNYMFMGCSSIKLSETKVDLYTNEYRIPKIGTCSAPENCVEDMFEGTGGTFTGTPNINKTYYAIEPEYLTFSAITDSTVTFNYDDGNDVYYSLDIGANWTPYTKGQTISLSAEKTLMFKGKYVTTDSNNHFSMTGKIAASGSVTSLTDSYGGNPDVVLADNYCYSYMFYECAALVSAPSLPATNLKPYCYYGMFADCTNLTTIECFPVSSLTNLCYGSMFYGCTSLTSLPEYLLPTTNLADGCYCEMFKDCTGLTYIPENLLPAGKNGEGSLAQGCYEEMFEGCTGLTLIPKNLLPATNLSQACYRSMFENCTSLVTIPNLPAAYLNYYCYNNMFSGCSSIKLSETKVDLYTNEFRIPKEGTGEAPDNCVEDMFKGTGGTFTGTPNINKTYYLFEARHLTFIADSDNSTITPKFVSGSYKYSTDNGHTWKTGNIDGSTVITLRNEGDKVLFSGTDCITNETNHFAMKGSIIASGDVTSLTNKVGGNETLTESCYAYMFSGCSVLKTVPNLPSTTLDECCYQDMFKDCDDLTTIPENLLPATTLADNCYDEMFAGCTAIETIPEKLLPATTLAISCYEEMFAGCASLASIPEKLLPATTLHPNCYSEMFNSCSDLTSIPEKLLPATALKSSCYEEMFAECTSIKTIPEKLLPATTLQASCYEEMFGGCTDLISVPNNLLPATSLDDSCYEDMFHGCTSLTTVPDLKATILKDNCYMGMFSNCESLTTLPVLSAKTLTDNCYQNMFYGCTSIKLSETQTGLYSKAYRIPTTEDGTTGTDSILNMFTATGGTFVGTPSINTTYYLWEKNTQTLSFASSSITKKYGDAKFTNTLNGAKTTVTYTIGNEGVASIDSTTGEVTILKIGTTTITATAIETEEYIGAKKSYTLTVNKCKVDVPKAKSNLVYSGEIQTGVEVLDTSLYKIASGNNTGKDANNYSVTLELKDKDNYEWNISTKTSENQKIDWKIAKKQLEVEGTTVADKTYDANTNAKATIGTVKGIVGSEDVKVSIDKANFSDRNAGTGKKVTVVYKMEGTAISNYLKPVNDSSLKANINKSQVVLPTAKTDLIYNRATQIGIKIDFDVPYTISGNTAIKAGNHTATVKLRDKNNYEWKITTPTSDDQEIEWSIAPKELSISDTTVANKTYDGTVTANVTVGELSGVITGDEVSVKVNSAEYKDKNAGVSKDVIIIYGLEGKDASNYEAPGNEQFKADIYAKQLTISTEAGKTTTVKNKTYDGNTDADATIGVVVGKVSGDGISVYISSSSFDNKNAGVNKKVEVTYQLDGIDVSNYKVPANETKEVDIYPKQLTISTEVGKTTTVKNKEYDGNTNATATLGTVVGKIDGDDATVYILSSTFDDKNVGIGKDVTVVYDLSGTNSSNYVVPVDDTIKASITQKPLTISGTTVANKTYDGTKTATSTVGTLDGVIIGDKVTPKVKSATFNNKDVGTGKQVTITYELEGKDASNYSLEDGTSSADINKRNITLTSGSASKNYDGTPLTNTTVTVSGDGFVSGEGATYDNFTSITGTSDQKGVSVTKNLFDYTLNAGTIKNNYDIVKFSGTLAIVGITEPNDMSYDAIKGFNASYTINQAPTLTAHITSGSSSSSIFVKDKDDNELIRGTDYTVEDGSVKINFQPTYLNKLAVGTYTYSINVDGTYYKVTLTVNAKPTPTPPYKPVDTSTK